MFTYYASHNQLAINHISLIGLCCKAYFNLLFITHNIYLIHIRIPVRSPTKAASARRNLFGHTDSAAGGDSEEEAHNDDLSAHSSQPKSKRYDSRHDLIIILHIDTICTQMF